MTTPGAGSGVAVMTLPRERDPIEVFSLLARDPRPALLQSAAGTGDPGRYSIVASDPFLVLRFREGRGRIQSADGETILDGDPFDALRRCLDRFRVPSRPDLPFPGGAIGYLGYGLRRYSGGDRGPRVSPSPWPDLQIGLYDRAFVIDHRLHCTHLVATGFPELEPARRWAKQRRDLRTLAEIASARPNRLSTLSARSGGRARFLTSRERYLEKIHRARAYLEAGDIYQVNLSHRIVVEGDWNPLPLYRDLVERHPARFSAFLPFRDHAVLCASPERFLRLAGDRAESRPIKGTRRRGANAAADALAARELAEGEKERAENVMIVDLVRNDLSRVCVAGSVGVDDFCRVETLPTVHHLVSTVSGRLRPDRDRVDLVRALFPGGSMTGAPKIRAMEIIDELEGEERGIYSGALGYFSFDGDLDLNIVIRTLVVKGRMAHLQVGGAILAESDPESEYQETIDKARPLLELLEGGGAGREETRRAGA